MKRRNGKAATSSNPTATNYNAMQFAYEHFNLQLFGDQLPPCLITLQRKNKAYGYFAGERFGATVGKDVTDEIALNPTHFADRGTEKVLSTLVHEMVHVWQHHFGTPPRKSYHNKEWAEKMHAVGLTPSSTGEPGGNETGQKVSHYVADGGAFAKSCAGLLGHGFKLPYIERWSEDDQKKAKKKAESKTKFTCEECDANAWGKPNLHIICGDCDVAMVAA